MAVTPDTARGQRFSEMLATEPQRENVYVSRPDAAQARDGNDLRPLLSFMGQFQSGGLVAGSHASAGAYKRPGADGGPVSDSDMASFDEMSMVLLIQENARISVMMNVLNSAKQGVTTLFHQQG